MAEIDLENEEQARSLAERLDAIVAVYKIKGTASRERAEVLQKHQSLIDHSLAAPGNRQDVEGAVTGS